MGYFVDFVNLNVSNSTEFKNIYNAEKEGFPRTANAFVFSIRKILREAMLNPHKVTYYCEYKCLGTLSLLAAIDLLTGEAIPLASESHKSSDFVTFLKLIDNRYPAGDRIRIILGNHSAHTSKETQEYLNIVSALT